MQSTKFRTNYNAKLRKSEVTKSTKMTVPGQSLTCGEHVKRARMGLSDQAVKLIFDPMNAYPDVRGLDLVEKADLLKTTREQVQLLKSKETQHKAKQKQLEAQKKANELLEQEQRMNDIIDKRNKKGGL